MMIFKRNKRNLTRKITSTFVLFSFIFSSILPPQVSAQSVFHLPIPGTLFNVTNTFNPFIIQGLTVDPQNPLHFSFIIDTGDTQTNDPDAFRLESTKLVKYFLASLTVPEDQMWVNLSPYEGNRIISDTFGQTEMGRDLLAQDYILKQMSASLTYSEEELGEKFWHRVHQRAKKEYGVKDIPLNTFNKVWIIPQKATVYEHDGSAYVVNSRLKVMMEEDYLALNKNIGEQAFGMNNVKQDEAESTSKVTSAIIKEIIIPELEKEVNEGSHFANLRQIYQSMILATWYKVNLKESLLGKVYIDQNKVQGIDLNDKNANQKIYEQYLAAFKKGVYNYIKEDYDSATHKSTPRQYFAGGFVPKTEDNATLAELITREKTTRLAATDQAALTPKGNQIRADFALLEDLTDEDAPKVQKPIEKIEDAQIAVDPNWVEDYLENLFPENSFPKPVKQEPVIISKERKELEDELIANRSQFSGSRINRNIKEKTGLDVPEDTVDYFVEHSGTLPGLNHRADRSQVIGQLIRNHRPYEISKLFALSESKNFERKYYPAWIQALSKIFTFLKDKNSTINTELTVQVNLDGILLIKDGSGEELKAFQKLDQLHTEKASVGALALQIVKLLTHDYDGLELTNTKELSDDLVSIFNIFGIKPTVINDAWMQTVLGYGDSSLNLQALKEGVEVTEADVDTYLFRLDTEKSLARQAGETVYLSTRSEAVAEMIKENKYDSALLASIDEKALTPEILTAFGGNVTAAQTVVAERLEAMRVADPNATVEQAVARLAWEYKPRDIQNVFPGDNWKFMFLAAKAGMKAPILLLDLEDAVATTRKEIARGVIVQLIRAFKGEGLTQDEFDFLQKNALQADDEKYPMTSFFTQSLVDGKTVYTLNPENQFHKDQMVLFRPNNLRTKWSAGDYSQVFRKVGHLVDGIYMPKVEGPEDIKIGASILRAIQKEQNWVVGRHKIFVLTELPGAVLTAENILKIAPEVEEVQLGVVDYTAATGGKNQVQIEQFPFMRYALLRLVEAANNIGKSAGLGITVQFTPEATAEDTVKAINIGLHRKWSVHPAHLKGMESFIGKFPKIVRKDIQYDELQGFDLVQLDQYASESRPILAPKVLTPKDVVLSRAVVTVSSGNIDGLKKALDSNADTIILDFGKKENLSEIKKILVQAKTTKSILVVDELDSLQSIKQIVTELNGYFQGFNLNNIQNASTVRDVDGLLSEAESDLGLNAGSLKIAVSFNDPQVVEEQSRYLGTDPAKALLYSSQRLSWAILNLPTMPTEDLDDPETRGYNYYHSLFIAMTAHAEVDSIDGYSADENLTEQVATSAIWGFQGKLANLNQVDEITEAMSPQRAGIMPEFSTPEERKAWLATAEGKIYVARWKNSLERDLELMDLYAEADQERQLGAVGYKDPLTGAIEIVDAASARIPFRQLEKALKTNQLTDTEKVRYAKSREKLLLAMRPGGREGSGEKVFAGQKITAPAIVMRPWMVNAFAKDGDQNRYHLDEAYANASKFKGLVAHGLLTVTKALSSLKAQLPAYKIEEVDDAKFLAPVRFNDTITPVIDVTSVDNEKANVKISVINQDGKTVSEIKVLLIESTDSQIIPKINNDSLKSAEKVPASIPAVIYDFTDPQSPREQTFKQEITSSYLENVQGSNLITSRDLLSQLAAFKMMAGTSANAVPGHILLNATNVKFGAEIHLGDVLTAKATVPAADQIKLTKDNLPKVPVTIEITNQNGEMVLKGQVLKLMEPGKDRAMLAKKPYLLPRGKIVTSPDELPTHMEAYVVRRGEHGDPIDAFKKSIQPVPDVGDYEVLVQVMAGGLNFNGTWALQGLPISPFTYPLNKFHDEQRLGSDASGIVVAVGKHVTQYKIGDQVVMATGEDDRAEKDPDHGDTMQKRTFVITGYETPDGTFGQFVALDERQVHPKEANMTWEQAASYHLVADTAWRDMKYKLGVKKGDTVLIWGASTGVGAFNVQIAKYLGAKNIVAVVSSASRAEQARKFGATQVINRTELPKILGYSDAEIWGELSNNPQKQQKQIEMLNKFREYFLSLTGGELADAVAEQIGQTTYPISQYLAKDSGKVTHFAGTFGFKFTFMGKDLPLDENTKKQKTPLQMLEEAGVRDAKRVLIYGADQLSKEIFEEVKKYSTNIAFIVKSQEEQNTVENWDLEKTYIKGIVDLNPISFPEDMPTPPHPDIPADKQAKNLEEFNEYRIKVLDPIRGSVVKALGGQPDLIVERAGNKNTLDISVFVVRPHGVVTYVESTKGKRLVFDARFIWMFQKQIYPWVLGTHYANHTQTKELNDLVLKGIISVPEPEVFSWDELPLAQQKMYENKLIATKASVLIGAVKPGLKGLPEETAAELPIKNEEGLLPAFMITSKIIEPTISDNQINLYKNPAIDLSEKFAILAAKSKFKDPNSALGMYALETKAFIPAIVEKVFGNTAELGEFKLKGFTSFAPSGLDANDQIRTTLQVSRNFKIDGDDVYLNARISLDKFFVDSGKWKELLVGNQILKMPINDLNSLGFYLPSEKIDSALIGEKNDVSLNNNIAESKKEYGGIDFNSKFLNLQIKRDGRGIPLPVNQQPLMNIHINGFYPVLIETMPINLPLILGLETEEEDSNSRTQQSSLDPLHKQEDIRIEDLETASILN
ncbi:MAG: zinc-binding dehydrogenase [Candidatus Omnitrophica bacterium]|nr:zinc-binding dehydrogenase [Candidatus Omnitrophota bacterium]